MYRCPGKLKHEATSCLKHSIDRPGHFATLSMHSAVVVLAAARWLGTCFCKCSCRGTHVWSLQLRHGGPSPRAVPPLAVTWVAIVLQDCVTGVCWQGKCGQPTYCTNGVKDGTESDVDCGGLCDVDCAVSQLCKANADCVSNVCTTGKCANAPTCSNGKKDGAETDVDWCVQLCREL